MTLATRARLIRAIGRRLAAEIKRIAEGIMQATADGNLAECFVVPKASIRVEAQRVLVLEGFDVRNNEDSQTLHIQWGGR